MSRLFALLLAVVFALPASAAPPAATDPEQKTVAEVNEAIDKGVTYLRKTRDQKTQWESYWIERLTGMEGGITGLATLALLNCQVPPDDPAVAEPLAYLRKLDAKKTYVVGLVNMCLYEARNPKDLPRIQSNVDWLVKTAKRSGGKLTGWSYPDSEGLERPDASNTQYALLGLYAGKMAGAKIEDAVWKEILELYKTTIINEGKETGSWSYVEGERKPSFTMTVAGVCGLLIARMGLTESGQGLDPATGVAANCGVYPETDAVRKGMNWIGREFAFDNALASKSLFYNVYGLERVGRLSGQRFIGDHDWYREGCDFLVLKKTKFAQRGEGSWVTQDDADFRGVNIISTSFALLFLSKGRSPVLISKLAHGAYDRGPKGLIVERGDRPGGPVGWNRKHNDVRNLTDFAGRELFKGVPLGWQVYDPRRKDFDKTTAILQEVGLLVQSPVLYFNGHSAPVLSDQQKDILKRYVEEGGFVLAEACCGSPEFADGFRKLVAELFPNSELKPVPAEHAVWRSHFLVPPDQFKKLEYMSRGCRTVLVFSPEPLAGYWEESKYMTGPGKPATNRGEYAFQLAANVIAYATGKEPPKQRLAAKKVVDVKGDDRSPRNGFVQPVQLKLDESPPAEAAMRNLAGHLRDTARLDVTWPKDTLSPSDPDLFRFKFLYMHGRKGFDLDAAAVENVRANLQSGALLLADACCGSEAFDAAFRKLAKNLFPDSELVPIPVDDPLYSAKVNGTKIDSVERREKAADAKTGGDAGYERLPPKLEGIKIDGRWAIVYSKFDLGCALEGHKSSDCLGHSPDSAKRLAAAAVLYSLKR